MKRDNTPTQWSSLWTAHVKVSLRKQKRVPVSSSGKCVSNSPLPSLYLCVCPDQDSCSVSQHHKCPYWGGLCPYDLSDVKSLRAFVNQPRNVSSPAKKNKNGRETHSQSRKVDISRGSFTRSTWVKWKIEKKKLIFVRTCQAVLTSFTFLSLHYEKWETRETWETRQSNLSKTDRNACKDIKEALYFEGLMVCKWGSVDCIWMFLQMQHKYFYSEHSESDEHAKKIISTCTLYQSSLTVLRFQHNKFKERNSYFVFWFISSRFLLSILL